jgi:hypothetical protein
MGDNQHVACGDRHLLSATETRAGITIGEQVITDDAFRARRQPMRVLAQRRYREAPGAGAFRVVENRTGHAHRAERFG